MPTSVRPRVTGGTAAVTDLPTPASPTPDSPTSASPTPGSSIAAHPAGGLRLLTVRRDGPVTVELAVPLGDAAGYWHPSCGWRRTLVPDWSGRAHTTLVNGAAAGCLYDRAGRPLFAFAALDPVPETDLRFGVSEEEDTYRAVLEVGPGDAEWRLLLSDGAPTVAAALGALRAGLLAHGGPELAPMPVPDSARTPAYSTWYAFNQQVSAPEVETEAAAAAELGCGVLLLDDGWQDGVTGRDYAGVGGWRPDPVKFPDLAGHVRAVRALGLRTMAWVAPLMVGTGSERFADLAEHAPVDGPRGCRILDPRRAEVRDHVVDVCTRTLADFGLDGLKIDFLDQIGKLAGLPAREGDVPDLGEAMRVLLGRLRAELTAIRPDVLIELRQPYIGPGMAAFGNLLRASDCPGDAIANRVQTVDVALFALGGAVHADMLQWDLTAAPESVARQVIAVLHAVPQLSVRLGRMPAAQRAAVRFWLARWAELYPVLSGWRAGAVLEPGRPDTLYPLVRGECGRELVAVVHEPVVVEVDTARFDRVTIVNGTAAERVVVAVRGPGALTVDGTWSADGSRAADGPRLTGLAELSVPAAGLARLSVEAAG